MVGLTVKARFVYRKKVKNLKESGQISGPKDENKFSRRVKKYILNKYHSLEKNRSFSGEEDDRYYDFDADLGKFYSDDSERL